MVCCGVCFEEFDADDAALIPRLLHCGHSFCTSCLTSLIVRSARSISCPRCRQLTLVDSSTSLNKNFDLVDAIQHEKQQPRNGNMPMQQQQEQQQQQRGDQEGCVTEDVALTGWVLKRGLLGRQRRWFALKIRPTPLLMCAKAPDCEPHKVMELTGAKVSLLEDGEVKVVTHNDSKTVSLSFPDPDEGLKWMSKLNRASRMRCQRPGGDLGERRVPEGEPSSPASLHDAATAGDVATIERLVVKDNVDVNSLDSTGKTALFLATEGGEEETVATLLALGALPGVRNSDGTLPLHRAVRLCNLSIAHHLVRLVDDIDAKEPDGDTCLAIAAGGSGRLSQSMVYLLLAHGAAVDGIGSNNETILAKAARGGDRLIVRPIIHARADPRAEFNGGQTALHVAAARARVDAVSTLIDNGAQPNARSCGYSPAEAVLRSGLGNELEETTATMVALVSTSHLFAPRAPLRALKQKRREIHVFL